MRASLYKVINKMERTKLIEQWWFWVLACITIIFVTSLIYNNSLNNTVSNEDYREMNLLWCDLDNQHVEYSSMLLENLINYDKEWETIPFLEKIDCSEYYR